MNDQISQVVRAKITEAAQAVTPELTRRRVSLPSLRGKAMCVIGMRRAGKTTFLHQCRADALAQGTGPERLIYFSFEDERLADLKAADLGIIPETHARLFPAAAEKEVTFYFDEIQRVPGWESFARRMMDEGGRKLFLSGSSARLLSREIATSMRGRGWEIVIHPFSFAEYLDHHGRAVPDDMRLLTSRQRTALDHAFAEYLTCGGFPEAQGLDRAERDELLQSYVDIILLRDVIERHGIANATALRQLVRRLLSAPAGLFSVQKFFAEMKSQGIAVTRDTLHTMVAHLEDAFLLHAMAVATDSERRRNVNPRKCYAADMALVHAYDRSGRANLGHALETAVFIELHRRKAEVGYVKTASGYEVDFLARCPDGKASLIQVCASLDDPATREREVRALVDAMSEHRRAEALILVAESRTPFPEVPKNVRIQPAWEWMLNAEI